MILDPSEDTRNVIDKYKGLPAEAIVADLDENRLPLEIAIENVGRDFNMGTIVRTANAFNVSKVHVIGSRQWNKRGAMKTDAYLHIDGQIQVPVTAGDTICVAKSEHAVTLILPEDYQFFAILRQKLRWSESPTAGTVS